MLIPTQQFVNSLRPYTLNFLESKARFNALMWHRGARKTTAILNRRLRKILTKTGLYWYIGPYLNQARDTVWKDPNTNFFRWIPKELLDRCDINKSDLSITFPNKSVWQIKGADHANALRGPKPEGIDVDEYGEIAKRWGSEFREAILEPSVRSTGGDIVYAGTPKGSNDFSYIFSLGGQDREWWSSLKTIEDTGLYSPEEIADIRRNTINLDFFFQEYYCRIIEGAQSVFKGIQRAVKGELEDAEPGQEYTFGIDLARTFDSTIILGFKNRDNHLCYFEKLSNKNWQTQRERIKVILRNYNNAEAVVDATGVGDSFVQSLLEDHLKIIPLKIANNLIKRNLIEKLATYIENRHISYPNIPDLISELQDFEYKLSSQNNVIYSAPSGKHDDIVMAMALAISRLYPAAEPEATVFIPMRVDSRTGYPI